MSKSMSRTKETLVIVGGGPVGLTVARKFVGASYIDTILIDKKDYFEYKAGLISAYVNPVSWENFSDSLPEVCARMGAKFIQASVTGMEGEHLLLDNGMKIRFTWLVYAIGCAYAPPGVDNLWTPKESEKTMEQRRGRIVYENSRMLLANGHEEACHIYGGGYIGVEWAGQLKSSYPKLAVTVFDSNPTVLKSTGSKVSQYCEKALKNLGVKTVMNTRSDSPDFESLYGSPKLFYNCVGVSAFKPVVRKKYLTENGFIRVNMHMEVIDVQGKPMRPGVFAIGNCNQLLPGIPKTIYVGESQAHGIAKSIQLMKPTAYLFGLNSLSGLLIISVGKCDAISIRNAHQPGEAKVILTGTLASAQRQLIDKTSSDNSKYCGYAVTLWSLIHKI